MSFISKSSPLPSNTFLSAEAVLWLMEHVENVSTEKKAISIMEQMLSRNLIRHCSGDTSRQTFMYGFYLYYILDKENSSPYQGNMEAFRCDWIEVRQKVLLDPLQIDFLHFLLRLGWSCSDQREGTRTQVIVWTKGSGQISSRTPSGDFPATSGTSTSRIRTRTTSLEASLWILTVGASRRDLSGGRANTKVGGRNIWSLSHHNDAGVELTQSAE